MYSVKLTTQTVASEGKQDQRVERPGGCGAYDRTQVVQAGTRQRTSVGRAEADRLRVRPASAPETQARTHRRKALGRRQPFSASTLTREKEKEEGKK